MIKHGSRAEPKCRLFEAHADFSGNWPLFRPSLTKKGDGEYRRLIYNAAVTAGRYDFKPHLERLKERGMKTTQAYVALARKLIRIAFALMKNRDQFDPKRLRIA